MEVIDIDTVQSIYNHSLNIIGKGEIEVPKKKLHSGPNFSIVKYEHKIPFQPHGLMLDSHLASYVKTPLLADPTVDNNTTDCVLQCISKSNDIYRLLNEAVWFYALKIKTDIEQYFKLIHKMPKLNDYPSCVNVCISKNAQEWLALEQSSYEYKIAFHDILETRFQKEFPNTKVGEKPSKISACPFVNCKKYEKDYPSNRECRNPLGNCAEQRAANDILINPLCAANNGISDLEFSLALRPRTMGLVPFCCNCKAIFPQL